MTVANARVVRNGDVELAVFEHGDPTADTVVLMHGWPDTHHLWTSVVPLLTDRFHVVSYDQRGHGRSTDPKGWRAFALHELAADLMAVVRAVSPDRPVHVLAHDWGSVSAWEAVCEPGAEQAIASFTSVSGPNLDHLGMALRSRLARPTPRNLVAPLQQLASSGYTFLFQVPVLNRLPFALMTEHRWKRFLRVVEGTPPERVHLGETFRSDLVSGLRIYRANLLPRLLRPRERHTEVPVQLVVNTKDIAVRPASFEDEHRWVRHLSRRDLPAGHWAPYSHPEALADALRSFVDELAGAEPGQKPARRARLDLA